MAVTSHFGKYSLYVSILNSVILLKDYNRQLLIQKSQKVPTS